MKKLSVVTALAVILCFAYTSCKKTTHNTNPTPSNTRLLSYTKTKGPAISLAGASLGLTTIETYTFSYDNSGRVSQIIFTTNDTSAHSAGLDNLIMTFDYTSSMIKKKITRSDYSLVEIDSFTEDGNGLVTNAYTPTMNNVYQYYNNLLIRNAATAHDSTGTAQTVSTITSNKGNFLELTYNDQVAINFTGLQPSTDSLTWVYYKTTLAGIVADTSTSFISGGSTTINSYNREPFTVVAIDTFHDTAYAFYPGQIWTTEDYTFYGDANRPGDYFQIQSFTTYGANIYQNANLVKTIKNSGSTKTISYTIDAQSEINQTSVSILDSVGATYSEIYKLQYQSY